MKGLVIYKLNSSTYIKEFYDICREFGIKNYALVSISSTDCLPGINYVLKQKEDINVYFFKDLNEFYERLRPRALVTLSKYGNSLEGSFDWLIVGHLDRLDIEQYNIKVIKDETRLNIIAGTTKFLIESHGAREL